MPPIMRSGPAEAPADYLYISEHNNYGDPSFGSLVEPTTRVQKVKLGDVSEPLHKDTRVVALFSTARCLIDFVAQGEEPDVKNATPMSEEYEITRTLHMGGGVRIATFKR